MALLSHIWTLKIACHILPLFKIYIKDLKIDIMNTYFYLYYQYWVTISNLFYLLLKYGWDRAYLAVILVSGLLSSIVKSRL